MPAGQHNSSMMSALSHLECPECGEKHDAGRVHTFCQTCNSPLLARYDLEAVRRGVRKEELSRRPRGMWRWRELLPVRDEASVVSLGEGDSPLLRARRLGEAIGLRGLFIKDESGQPTGTFKARGLAAAVSKARELGLREFVIPTAGNAGGALAAYAARAGLPAHVFMPADAPAANAAEVRATGAELHLVNGLIGEAGRMAGEAAREHGWFDVSTFKEPYRLEGKKTMGLELAEGFDWKLPEIILYPTGGGTGLVGMWKAFRELEWLGWLQAGLPRMVSIQSAGCAPIVRAFEAGAEKAEAWQDACTMAPGLRVPQPFGDRLILRVLYESKGTAVAVSDDEMLSAQKRMAALEGIFAAPEGAATLAGAIKLLECGWLDPGASIVLYNTGTGLKYI